MKVPLAINKELAHRGWTMLDGESWRYPRGYDWACAYFEYKNDEIEHCCLITVSKDTFVYNIEVLCRHPICPAYLYANRKFNIRMSSLYNNI